VRELLVQIQTAWSICAEASRSWQQPCYPASMCMRKWHWLSLHCIEKVYLREKAYKEFKQLENSTH